MRRRWQKEAADTGSDGFVMKGPRIPKGLRRYAVNLMIRQGFVYANSCEWGLRLLYPMLRPVIERTHLEFQWGLEEMVIDADLHPQEMEYFRSRLSWNWHHGYGETGHRQARLRTDERYEQFTDRNEDGWVWSMSDLERSFERVKRFNNKVEDCRDQVFFESQQHVLPWEFRVEEGESMQDRMKRIRERNRDEPTTERRKIEEALQAQVKCAFPESRNPVERWEGELI